MNHAQERAIERLGVALAGSDLRAMSSLIIQGKAIKLDRHPVKGKAGREQWLVTYAGRAFRVIYDPLHEVIVTVLPKFGKGRARSAQ